MDNALGKIVALPPAAAAAPAAQAGGSTATDSSLPDATRVARYFLAATLGLALVVGAVMNWRGWTAKPFDPAKVGAANFALFAGFYVGAQVIERVMQLVAPTLPWWQLPASVGTDRTVRAAQTKADRTLALLGLSSILGVAASCGFGLFFLAAIGMHVTHTVDSWVTGITIAAGTKPLHDFITLLQNQNTPKTGTGS